jgi:hypothetical protein
MSRKAATIGPCLFMALVMLGLLPTRYWDAVGIPGVTLAVVAMFLAIPVALTCFIIRPRGRQS